MFNEDRRTDFIIGLHGTLDVRFESIDIASKTNSRPAILTGETDELGRRYGLFYVIGSVTSAFSGILAFGLIQLNGKAGLRGWRWIFIIEGMRYHPRDKELFY